ncbi:MAG: hypothetical protein NVSMB62_27510 [Acidobacteriaceae bacterium]
MKNTLRLMTAAAALSIAVTALPAMAAPAAQEQEHRDTDRRDTDRRDTQQHPDYSNNNYYRLGNREGYQDYSKKEQRKNHNHKYRGDDDRAAHDYGYQQGWQGQRGYNSDPNRRPDSDDTRRH